MKKVNRIVISRDNYEEDFEWKEAIQNTIFLLLENRYIMTIRKEEVGIVIIEYDYDWNVGYGERAPVWLTCSERLRLVYDEDEDEVDEEE